MIEVDTLALKEVWFLESIPALNQCEGGQSSPVAFIASKALAC